MSFATVNCIVAIVVNLAVGAFVLIRSPRETVNRLFALITLSLVLTSAGELIMRLTDTSGAILLGARIGFLGWAFLGVLALHFALAFAEEEAILRRWWLYPVLYGPSVVLVVIAWTTSLVYEGFSNAPNQGFVESEGVLRYPATFIVVVPLVIGIYVLWRYRRRAPSKEARQDTLVLLAAAVSMLVLSFITDVLLIFINKENPPVNLLTFSTLMALGFAYAVTRHGLMRSSSSIMGRTLISIMMDPVLVLDADGVVRTANPAMTELTGFDRKHLKGMPVGDLLRPDVGDEPVSIAGGTPPRWSGVCLDAGGDELPVVVNTGTLESGSGRKLGSVVVVHDMRETMERILAEENAHIATVRAEAERRHAQALQEVIDVACHELRTPAAVFKGYAAILSSTEGLDEEHRLRALESIDSAADRVTRLSDSLLETSLVSGGKLHLREEDLDAGALLDESVRLVERRFPDHRFVGETGGVDVRVRADGDMLVSVLIALMENAAKFSPAGTEVRAWCEQADGETLFHVRDQGEGIPAEHREAVFERFYQVADSLHHSRPGLGLGLYVARRIVEAHGGTIAIRPAGADGTEFYFSIPSRGSGEGRD